VNIKTAFLPVSTNLAVLSLHGFSVEC